MVGWFMLRKVESIGPPVNQFLVAKFHNKNWVI